MEKEKALKEMADLLLSKATMLRYHCAECKSPLFEKDGKIICPVCGEFDRKSAKEKKKKSHTRDILKKKRDELLKQLEKEKDPKKISELAEAISKLEKIL